MEENRELEQYRKRFPENTYQEKQFNFTKKENSQLSQLDILSQFVTLMTQTIEQLHASVINQGVLPRIGITPSRHTGMLYDTVAGEFRVWIPKNPCVSCGTPLLIPHIHNGASYCDTCFELVGQKEEILNGKA